MIVISRRNFIKGSALIPMISPMAVIARLSNDNKYKIDETKAWILRARNSIPTTKDAFFQTARIGPWWPLSKSAYAHFYRLHS